MIDTGDTAFILVAAGFGTTHDSWAGSVLCRNVRTKNVLGTIMHSFVCMALVTVVWVLWGYSLAFGPDIGGVIGSLSMFGLNA